MVGNMGYAESRSFFPAPAQIGNDGLDNSHTTESAELSLCCETASECFPCTHACNLHSSPRRKGCFHPALHVRTWTQGEEVTHPASISGRWPWPGWKPGSLIHSLLEKQTQRPSLRGLSMVVRSTIPAVSRLLRWWLAPLSRNEKPCYCHWHRKLC